MSRIGKKTIEIPQGVEVKIDNNLVIVKGPKGELKRETRPEIKIEVTEKEISFIPTKQDKKTQAFWGLTRSLVNNMVQGVTDGFEKKLQIEGVGYKAILEGDLLVLNLGFSHQVKIKAPDGVNFVVEKNLITLSGIDKELVTQTAAKIKQKRKPDPYKGKGIRYFGEIIKKKVGKKAAGSGK
jgi:large subunit ribosomal protein L6